MKRTLAIPLLLLLAACPKHTQLHEIDVEELGFQRQIIETITEDGLIREEIDLNRDKQSDVFNYYRERTGAARLLVRKEVDINRDGVIDNISYFDEGGELEREEMDRDFNGKFDWIDHYMDGHRVMSEFDTSSNGQMNVFNTYANGVIAQKERDTDDDGRIDYWERYEGGKVVKVGRDTDGDGKMDTRE
ncbi:MAG: hypothetical protein JXX28_08980 [Deltaproteobacteria bacterium]|nr:hypothetical protein [Deltaproteobacteria bacterium]